MAGSPEGAEQVAELALRDPVGPDRRVVVRVARHRHDPAAGRLHHRRALVDAVTRRPGSADRAVECLLRDRLHLGVDRGHERVAGLRGRAADGGEHVARRVHRDDLAARLAGQVRVVLGLEAGLADQVVAREAGLGYVVGRHLRLGDRLQVAEHLGRVGAVRHRVVDHRLERRGDPDEDLRLLHDLQRDRVADVLRHRDRLVRRPGPAGLGNAAGAEPDLLGERLVRQVQQRGEPLEHGRAVVGRLSGRGPSC